MQADMYARMAVLDPKVPAQDVIKNLQAMTKDRYDMRESGLLDKGTGMFYPFPKGDLVEREIGGSTYMVDSRTAAMLDFMRANDDPRYWELADRVIKGPPRPDGAPAALRSKADIENAEAARKLEAERVKAREIKLADAAAKREAESAVNDQNARRIYGITERVNNSLNQSQNYFGIFQRPGLVSAIGNVVSQGLQTPGGTLNLPTLETAIRNTLPGIKQQDIDNIQTAMADLAELELIYTRIYLSGQGQVTEGERKVVRGILAGPQNSPDAVRARMMLLRERSQHDMDLAEAWRRYSSNNPSKSIIDFEKTNEYSNLLKSYEEKMAQIEKRTAALPGFQRAPRATPGATPGATPRTPPAARPGTPGSLEAARERLRRELQR